MSISEQRLRILKMIEGGQVSAQEGSQLIEALGEPVRERSRPNAPPRTLRVRVTNLATRRQIINVTIPAVLATSWARGLRHAWLARMPTR